MGIFILVDILVFLFSFFKGLMYLLSSTGNTGNGVVHVYIRACQIPLGGKNIYWLNQGRR